MTRVKAKAIPTLMDGKNMNRGLTVYVKAAKKFLKKKKIDKAEMEEKFPFRVLGDT